MATKIMPCPLRTKTITLSLLSMDTVFTKIHRSLPFKKCQKEPLLVNFLALFKLYSKMISLTELSLVIEFQSQASTELRLQVVLEV